VVVAAAVARQMHLPLDIIVVRKIGHPDFREFAVGALAEGDVLLLHEEAIAKSHVRPEALQQVIREERQRLDQYVQQFRPSPSPPLQGKTVLLVDDGLATGATMEAAVQSARKRAAAKIIVGVPVASDTAVEHLRQSADAVHALFLDPSFHAVGAYYQEFPQTSDDEVKALLNS
jgi:predicted phosphoribosyltransferase